MEHRMRNDCLDAAVGELEQAGIRDYEVAHGGKHIQLRWHAGDHRRLRIAFIATTPSDHRSPQNTRRDVRRLLRLDNMLAVPATLSADQRMSLAASENGSPPHPPPTPRRKFSVTFVGEPGVDAIKSFRSLLKLALRRFGLRAVDVRELDAHEQAGQPR
jgi:hypothetical protein